MSKRKINETPLEKPNVDLIASVLSKLHILGSQVENSIYSEDHVLAVGDRDDLKDLAFPGCYWIETNMPKEAFIQEGKEGKMRATPPKGYAKLIKQVSNEPYIIYNGTMENVRDRLRQHLFDEGSESVSRLGLVLNEHPYNQYNWWVRFHRVDDPIIRYAVEAWWRKTIGWPMFCRRS